MTDAHIHRNRKVVLTGFDSDKVFEAHKAQSAVRKAIQEAEHTFAVFMETVTSFDLDNPTEATKFDRVAKQLREEFLYPYWQGDSKKAIHELVRKSVTNEGAERGFTYWDVLRFVKTADFIHDQAYKPLFEVIKDRGDDAYGDLLDALCLAGAKICRHAMAGQYQFEEDLVNDITKRHGKEIAERILHGENYIRMFGQEQLMRFIPTVYNDLLDKSTWDDTIVTTDPTEVRVFESDKD